MFLSSIWEEQRARRLPPCEPTRRKWSWGSSGCPLCNDCMPPWGYHGTFEVRSPYYCRFKLQTICNLWETWQSIRNESLIRCYPMRIDVAICDDGAKRERKNPHARGQLDEDWWRRQPKSELSACGYRSIISKCTETTTFLSAHEVSIRNCTRGNHSQSNTYEHESILVGLTVMSWRTGALCTLIEGVVSAAATLSICIVDIFDTLIPTCIPTNVLVVSTI